jgi:hypothetical protein
MAAAQDEYRFAHCLEIVGPATIRVATTDLPQDAATTTLGAFYKRKLKAIDQPIVDALPNLFYGVQRRSRVEFVIDNSDGEMDTTDDWRLATFTLYHYDITNDVRRTDMTGVVLATQFANGQAAVTLGTLDEATLQDLLPAATIDPKASSPFETSPAPAAPIPVVFGNDVIVKPPCIAADTVTDGAVTAIYYAVGFGDNLRVEAVWGDLDLNRAGLEKYGNWEPAPGTPTYSTTRKFTVTDNQSVRYQAGLPIRFKTTASGSSWLYSVVKAYDDAPSPDTVEIYDPLLGPGLNSVQLIGDFHIIRDVYVGVTDGLLPLPGSGQDFTVIRLFNGEDATMLALTSNPDYSSGSGGVNISTIIQAILTNAAWGLSAYAAQSVNAASFTAAGVILALSGLTGAVQGALAYDQRQHTAEEYLDALLMMRGMRLAQNASSEWTLSVDALGASVATFSFGPGEQSGARIKRVLSYGRAPLDQAVRNVVLHYSPLGRAKGASDRLTPREYARFATKPVSGIGQDLHLFNPFIRSDTVASKVIQYVAEMLKGADEQLVFSAGQEARDRVPGEVITAVSTIDGFSGDWKISQVSKTLAEVQLTCIRQRAQAYDAPAGDIVLSSEPTDDADARTDPGPGPNLIPNPDLSPPLSPDPTFAAFGVPHGWEFGPGSGSASELSFDKSAAVRSRVFGGHYCRIGWSSVTAGVPSVLFGDGMYIERFPIKGGIDYLFSFYGDADDGWFVRILEFTSSDASTSSLLPLVRDSTDTNGMGWPRIYGRWRAKNSSVSAYIGICQSKTGTYQFGSVQLEAFGRSARKPTGWRRHTPIPQALTRSQEITLNGASSYTAPLIKAGDRVHGATLRITQAFTLGTATNWSLGTSVDEAKWAAAKTLVALDDQTSSRDFAAGSQDLFYASDTNVQLLFNGTATAGKAMIVVEFTRSSPTPGA